MQDESTPDNPAPGAEAPPPDTGATRADGSSQTPPTGEQGQSPADIDSLRQQLMAAEARAQESWERALRATAEQDNIRKRAEREIDNARRFALERFAQDLLKVRDSLELGLKAAREAGADPSHVEGTELTLKMLCESMSRHGIEAIDPAGEPFDPSQHEAMSAVPTADAAPNSVLEVMQKGYRLNDRVLRPAMVVVAKAPPAADSSEQAPPA